MISNTSTNRINKTTMFKRCVDCKSIFTNPTKNPFINKCPACFQKSSLLNGHCLIKLK